jgi:serine/threonine protein kinase
VKVADFGLARLLGQENSAANLTKVGITMGTPLYMSPEQVEGKPVDHRSDIYSFGVTCYHLFAGHPPFRGESPFEVALQHVNTEPRPLAEIRPDLPADLCGLVQKMMMKLPEARYQTGREIARDASRLRDAIVAGGGHLYAPMLSGLTPSGTTLKPGATQGIDSPTVSNGKRPNVRRQPWLFAGVVAICLCAGLAVGWLLAPSPIIAVPMPSKPPEGKTGEAPPVVRELFFAGDREKDLLHKVQDFLRNPVERGPGLDSVMDLGAIYLRERRLDEAEAYFKDLGRPDRRVPQYRAVGDFGQAMVYAFRDHPDESNKLFVKALDFLERTEAKLKAAPAKTFEGKKDNIVARLNVAGFWKQNVAWREQMADALNRNFVNAPDSFPADQLLQGLRNPPMPGGKGPVALP